MANRETEMKLNDKEYFIKDTIVGKYIKDKNLSGRNVFFDTSLLRWSSSAGGETAKLDFQKGDLEAAIDILVYVDRIGNLSVETRSLLRHQAISALAREYAEDIKLYNQEHNPVNQNNSHHEQ